MSEAGVVGTTVPVVEELVGAIEAAYEARLQAEIDARPPQKQRWLYMGSISPCRRANAYAILAGDQAKRFEPYVQALLDTGNQQEQALIAILIQLGFGWEGGQDGVEIKNREGDVIARGRIEGFVRYKGQRVPAEIKSMGEMEFKRLGSVEDFKTEKLKRYLRQFTLYLYGNGYDCGVFIITDCRGHIKVLPFYLDLGFAEQTLQIIEQSYAAAKKGELPDRITYHPAICGTCKFESICMPTTEVQMDGEVLPDEQWAAAAERYVAIAPIAKEFEGLKEQFKEFFSSRVKTLLPNGFEVVTTTQERKMLDRALLPPEALKAALVPTPVKLVKVRKIA